MEKSPTILIVDDDQDICFLLQEILMSFNISCTSAHSIRSAKSQLSKINPSHILLDNNLPDGDGITFIGYLSKFYPTIKIVLLTGDSEITGECLEEILKILQKPFTKDTIKEAFNDLILISPKRDVE